MSRIAIPIAYATLIWWLSTGAILYVVGRSRRTYPFSILVGLGLLAGALWALTAVSSRNTAWDAHVAFTGAVIVWGFVELTFLTGYVTGSRTTPCPAGSRGWRRTRYAIETIIYHELALISAGVAVLWATWDGVNYVAIATFLVLWVMRLSSKLNLFLGVRTLNDELLPRQLQHLRSYFVRKEMNALFPISVIGSGFFTTLLVVRAIAPDANEFETAGYLLVASLLALALIEHAFMMLPVPIARLWGLDRPRAPAIATKTELAATSQARLTRDRTQRGRP
jgi:putative photosynthetic complex assembly protein 2